MAIEAQTIVDAIAARLNVDNAAAENAVGTILSILQHEAGGTKIAALFDNIPGAQALAQSHDVLAGGGGGGLLDSIGSVFGEKANALVHGMTQLSNSGLSMEQIKQASSELLAQAKTATGPDLVNELLDSVPALKGHLGL